MSTYEQFVLQGEIKGEIKTNIRIAKRLLAKGFTIVQIVDLMDLPIEEVEKLLEKIAQQ